MADLNINWYFFSIPIGVILIGLLAYGVVKLRTNRALAEKICYYLSWTVLIYKTFHYIIYCTVLAHPWNQQIPCEISQITFFLCPIAYLSQNKYVRDAGAFMGIFAGAVQVFASTVAPFSFANSGTLVVFSFLESTIMHYFVLVIGLLEITCVYKLKVKNGWTVYFALLLILLWGVLASFTWRFGTDAGYPNEPANIGFVQRCVLPAAITDHAPWLLEGHLFIIPYLMVFFVFTAAVYLVSHLSFRHREEQEKGFYGMGWHEMHKFLKAKSNGNNQQ